MFAVLEAIVWPVLVVLDLAGLVWEIVVLRSTLRDALTEPLKSLLWFIAAVALGVALAAWEEREDVGLAATLTAVGIGACALAIAVARRRGKKLCDESKQTGTRS